MKVRRSQNHTKMPRSELNKPEKRRKWSRQLVINYTNVRLHCVAYLKMLISTVCKSAIA